LPFVAFGWEPSPGVPLVGVMDCTTSLGVRVF
jgi:hypothetical protein